MYYGTLAVCISQGSIKEAEPLKDSNQDCRGKGILGNVVQLSQVDALQSHHLKYLLTALRIKFLTCEMG